MWAVTSRTAAICASMGGTWMMASSYGFGGMRDDDGTLSFWPASFTEKRTQSCDFL